MPILYPSTGTLQKCFHNPLVPTHAKERPTPYQARPELYSAAFSVVDDAKDKTKKLSAEATKEFEKASSKAQAASGRIELYSSKYYAACTFGGLLACVSFSKYSWQLLKITCLILLNIYQC
jgi:solute carrier family 25 (mitochondrial phosphate transporter), member 3